MIGLLYQGKQLNWDYFSKQPALRVGLTDGYNTLIGQIFTIILFLIILGLSAYFGRDIIERQNPQVVLSQRFDSVPAIIEFGFEQGVVAIGLTTFEDWAPYADDQVFRNSKPVKTDGATEFIIYNQEIEAEHCDFQKHFSRQNIVVQDYFNRINYQTLYCVPTKFKIGGNSEISDYYSFNIKFKICEAPNNCKSTDQIYSRLSKVYLNFYSTTSVLDQKISANPLEKNVQYFWSIASINFSKWIQVEYSIIECNMDQGIFFEDNILRSSQKFHAWREIVYDEKSNIFLNLSLETINEQNIYSMSYKKIQEVFAEVQGTMELVFIFFLIIIPWLIDDSYYNMVGSYIYDFDQKEKTHTQLMIQLNQAKQIKEKVKEIEESPVQNEKTSISTEFKNNYFKKPMKNSEMREINTDVSISKQVQRKKEQFHQFAGDTTNQLVVDEFKTDSNSFELIGTQNERIDFISGFEQQQPKSKIEEENSLDLNQISKNSNLEILIQKLNEAQIRKSMNNQLQKYLDNIKQQQIKRLKKSKILAQINSEEINYSCDIINILNLSHEVDLIKKLLLSPDMYNLFPYFQNQRKQIYNDQLQVKNIPIQQKKQEQDQLLKAFQSFLKFQNSENQKEISLIIKKEILNLFNLLENDLSSYSDELKEQNVSALV